MSCYARADTQYLPSCRQSPLKLVVEKMLQDASHAHGLRSVSLRYFNATGAVPDGEIGEAHDPETHLIPLVTLIKFDRPNAIA
jgi:UDP-glucose 4-epimerase